MGTINYVDLSLAPCTVKRALRVVAEWHRHLPKLQGGLFAVAVNERTLGVVGVGICGAPAQEWEGSGRIVISRVAVLGFPNTCSMIYGALSRAAKALGYAEIWTYTLPDEPGTSLRASGFTYMGMTAGGEHDRVSRRRAPAVRPEPKKRWMRKL